MKAVYERGAGSPFASRSEALGTRGMVATSQVFATQAGMGMLRSGGNAIDAAIAANAVLGLTEPTGCGIGGDLFAMVWEAGMDAPAGLNASGRAPRSLNLDVFAERGLENIPSLGPLPVSVPGAVDGWHELHKRYGSKDFAELLAPAIALDREGFPVAQLTAAAPDGGRLALEPGFGPEVRKRLSAMGHRVSNARGVFGGYQAVMHDAESGVLTGASDPRKDGQAAGL